MQLTSVIKNSSSHRHKSMGLSVPYHWHGGILVVCKITAYWNFFMTKNEN
jgi:hypothetical protein